VKRYRLLMISAVGLLAVLVGMLLFGGLNQDLVYYLTPAEALAQRSDFSAGQRLQIGGLVEAGSVTATADGLRFVLESDTAGTGPKLSVVHRGAPAQLFAAGTGVVVEGVWQGQDFVSDSMIVKHDETYSPPTTQPVQADGGTTR
jgi:cytochrome c-type biogenesis protein CcmE